jgi:Kef-type K+ transport system membrane component KefB
MFGLIGFLQEFITETIQNIPAHETIIFQLAFILIVSILFAFLARILKQPLIPAYVLAGLIIGPIFLGLIRNTDIILALANIGIAFLLFISGLEISIKKIKEANWKKIIFIGIFQVILTFLFVLAFAGILKLSILQASYIGIILAFSSTMVVVKILGEKNELVTLHGRIILGVLLLQDLIAIVAITIFTSPSFSPIVILSAIFRLAIVVLLALLMQKFFLARIFRYSANSRELLFLSSIGILFLFIFISYLSNLTLAIGAFIAGVCLANSPFKLEVESRLSSLKDFFSILFFVSLGLQIVFSGLSSHLFLFIFILIGAIIVKPVVILILVRATGYRPKTSFFSAISLAQLSEFSLMLGFIGITLQVFDISVFSVITLATIITMSITVYFIEYQNKLYFFIRNPVKKMLGFLPLSEPISYSERGDKEIVLVGCHRVGSIILSELGKEKGKLLVVDHDPAIISALSKKKYSTLYGDLSSPDLLESLPLSKLKTIISTIPNLEDSLHLLNVVGKRNPDAKVILTAARISEAIELYKKGADYVLLPKILAGEELSQLSKLTKEKLKEIKKRHLTHLEKIHNILY